MAIAETNFLQQLGHVCIGPQNFARHVQGGEKLLNCQVGEGVLVSLPEVGAFRLRKKTKLQGLQRHACFDQFHIGEVELLLLETLECDFSQSNHQLFQAGRSISPAMEWNFALACPCIAMKESDNDLLEDFRFSWGQFSLFLEEIANQQTEQRSMHHARNGWLLVDKWQQLPADFLAEVLVSESSEIFFREPDDLHPSVAGALQYVACCTAWTRCHDKSQAGRNAVTLSLEYAPHQAAVELIDTGFIQTVTDDDHFVRVAGDELDNFFLLLRS